MSQPIGKLGTIQTKNYKSLKSLEAAVKASLASKPVVEGSGLFNPALVEALIRPFHERQSASRGKSTGPSAFNLRSDDYQRATELLQERPAKGSQSRICLGRSIFQH